MGNKEGCRQRVLQGLGLKGLEVLEGMGREAKGVGRSGGIFTLEVDFLCLFLQQGEFI